MGRHWQVLAELKLLGVLVVVSVAMIPLGYGCRGLGHSTDRLKLYSPSFLVVQQRLDGTSLRSVTGLLPRGYLEGMDQQAVDLDGAWINYFDGRESTAGWLTYYPTALALKTPVAFWWVLILALLATLRGARAAPADELCLLVVPVLLCRFLWASSSLTFLRYLLPIYPPLIVSLGRATSLHSSSRRWRQVGIVAVGLTTLAPLLQHPHYLGYFNLIAGGPRACWPVFADSEVDWGQDLHVLQRWQQSHPEARPMRLALFTPFHPPHPRLADDFEFLTDKELSSMGPLEVIPEHPEPGYLAISVTHLNRGAALSEQPHDVFAAKRPFLRWLKQTRTPLAFLGTSILIDRLTDEDATDWSRSQE